MRKLQLLATAIGAVAIIVPATGSAGLHDNRSPARPVHGHTGNGKAGPQKGGPSASSYSIGLLAPWGNAAYAGGHITVSYTLSSAPGVPGSARTAVQSALTSWNSCLGGGSGCGGLSPKGRFSFTAATASPLLTITIKKGGGTVAGSTKLTYSGGFISAARMQISASSFGSPNTAETVYEIALHELGHVVGLGHSNDPSDLMYPVLNGTTSFGSCEVNGFDALYSGWLGSGNPTLPSQSSVGC